MKPKIGVTNKISVDLTLDIKDLIGKLLSIDEDNTRYLSGLSMIMVDVEKKVNFESILRTVLINPSLNFHTASRTTEDRFTYCKSISRIIQRLTIANAYNWDDDQLLSCAIDILYHCRDWNMADMVYFIYQVRNNPFSRKEFVKDKLVPSDLMNMIPVYNDMRAIEHERIILTVEMEKASELPTHKKLS